MIKLKKKNGMYDQTEEKNIIVIKPKQKTKSSSILFHVILWFVLTMGSGGLLRYLFGQPFGSPCDQDTICEWYSVCVDQVCTMKCQQDEDCPDPWKCLPQDKVCNVPNELSKRIQKSLEPSMQKLQKKLNIIRKRTDTYNVIIIQNIRNQLKITRDQFEASWQEFSDIQKESLSPKQLAQLITKKYLLDQK